MSWNYRIVKHSQQSISSTSVCFTMHEVFYDKRGKIDGWSDAMHPLGETLSELQADLRYMRRAFKLPILEMKNGKLVKVKS